MDEKTKQASSRVKGMTSTILFLVLLVSIFLIGRLSAQVELLTKGRKPTGKGTTLAGTAQNPDQPGSQVDTTLTVSVDDDPVLGSQDAAVVMIEFSDFECPYCKTFWQGAFPELKKNYIDTGKLKLVYRDLPLPFHDPLATDEALAANCARDQQGDEMYFLFHDEIFSRTNSNGNGMPRNDLQKIAAGLGLNATAFNTCLNAGKFKDEIQNDVTSAQAIGINGTPTFVIGKLKSGGQVEGERLIGAQPYSAFQPVIEKYLK